ncbi:HAMP domain-containing histidine kinase [Ferrovibrio terrae]|uniref:histidine kinase n=1 Tax=Ferrovibrio terrae TaxID=2594003 RepID=A0A516H1M4_9PROT|nr:HAMP domain-containing sensor histidine kinase [Ferrovibrio terrae]QDO97666.1 HAMP domain-containing histidine kinase [Ferrovibrio terrae]
MTASPNMSALSSATALRWYDTAFADAAKEREFQQAEGPSAIVYARLALGLAAVLFASFGITDWLFAPNALAMSAIRAASILVLLIAFGATYSPRVLPHHQLLMQVGALSVSIGYIGIVALAPPPLLPLYLDCVVLIIIGIFVVLRMGTLRASLSVLVVMALLDATYLYVGLGTQQDFIVYQLIMLTAFAIGFFSNYIYERQRRIAYLGRRGAEQQAARLEQALRRAAEAQMQAEQAARVKSDFVAHVSHELRTPLNAVIGFGEVLERQIFGPLGHAKYAEYARDIRESGQHLLSLINDVLDLSKVEAGRMELHRELLAPHELARASLVLVSGLSHVRGTRIAVDVSQELPPVFGDSRAIKQMLVNLLSNALKFSPPGGQVSITADAGDRHIRFVISDNGPGMTAEQVQIAMTPFGQVSGMVADSERGTGLGLALANSLAELHGAPLRLESEPGRGTRAIITLPRGHAHLLAPAEV